MTHSRCLTSDPPAQWKSDCEEGQQGRAEAPGTHCLTLVTDRSGYLVRFALWWNAPFAFPAACCAGAPHQPMASLTWAPVEQPTLPLFPYLAVYYLRDYCAPAGGEQAEAGPSKGPSNYQHAIKQARNAWGRWRIEDAFAGFTLAKWPGQKHPTPVITTYQQIELIHDKLRDDGKHFDRDRSCDRCQHRKDCFETQCPRTRSLPFTEMSFARS